MRPFRVGRPGTCSRCGSPCSFKLMHRVLTDNGRVKLMLCPKCWVPSFLPRRRRKKAVAAAVSEAMAAYKAGMGLPRAPEEIPPDPIYRFRPEICTFVGCGKAGTVAPDGRIYCFAHAPARVVPVRFRGAPA